MQRRSFLGWMFAAPVAAKAATALPVTPAPVAVPEIVAAEISKVENEIELRDWIDAKVDGYRTAYEYWDDESPFAKSIQMSQDWTGVVKFKEPQPELDRVCHLVEKTRFVLVDKDTPARFSFSAYITRRTHEFSSTRGESASYTFEFGNVARSETSMP